MTASSLLPIAESTEDLELLWRMFDESPVRTAVLTPEGRFRCVNRALCATLGFSREELLVRTFAQIGHPDAHEEGEAAAMMQALMSGSVEQREMDRRCVDKSGQVVWLHVLGRPLRDANGKPRHALLVIRDATGRKRAEKSLRENEERFRQVAHFSKDVFWVLDIQPTLRVYVNPAFKDVWGWFPEGGTMTFGDWRSSVHPDDRERVAREFQSAQNGDTECNVEYRIVRPDGSVRHIHDRGVLIRDVRGRPYRVAGVAIDVTERVAMERLRNEFISIVSHELRTPLTSLRASLGLIDGGIVGEVPDEMKSLVRIAKEGSERLVRLLNDLLDIEKIESGRFEYRMEQVDLVALTAHVIDSTRALGNQRGIEILATYDVDEAPVIADGDRLTQVITNLLSNATKFSAEGAPVEVSVRRNGQAYRVAVLDYGVGIPPEFREKVFQKFAQADSSSTRAHGGTGLGLSIARSIVERHGGTIDFDSEPGRGTVFFFDIPTAEAAAQSRR